VWTRATAAPIAARLDAKAHRRLAADNESGDPGSYLLSQARANLERAEEPWMLGELAQRLRRTARSNSHDRSSAKTRALRRGAALRTVERAVPRGVHEERRRPVGVAEQDVVEESPGPARSSRIARVGLLRDGQARRARATGSHVGVVRRADGLDIIEHATCRRDYGNVLSMLWASEAVAPTVGMP
jgi:hypothetical protein